MQRPRRVTVNPRIALETSQRRRNPKDEGWENVEIVLHSLYIELQDRKQDFLLLPTSRHTRSQSVISASNANRNSNRKPRIKSSDNIILSSLIYYSSILVFRLIKLRLKSAKFPYSYLASHSVKSCNEKRKVTRLLLLMMQDLIIVEISIKKVP